MLVDSSVWIDYFNEIDNRATNRLDQDLGMERIIVADIVLAEVLSGFKSEGDFRKAERLLSSFEIHFVVGVKMAIRSARNYRHLRARGITVRKMRDVLIASYCIEHKLYLLHRDRDFDPFVQLLGLKSVLH